MVKIINRTDSKGDIYPIPYSLHQPKSVVIRFGRAFIVVVETSKKTWQIFHNRMEQLREFTESVRDALIEIAKEIFGLEASVVHSPKQTSQFPLRQAAPWIFRVPEARTCKNIATIGPKLQPLLKVTAKVFKELNGPDATNPTQSPIETTKLGAGIPNGQNCCFLASVLQALRVSPSFRNRLKAPELKNMPVVQELRQIYSIIEGKRGVEKRNLTPSEIDHFRKTCIESGMPVYGEGSRSMECTAEVSEFILCQVGFKDFKMKEYNKHSFEIPVNALDKSLPLTNNHVIFQLGDSQESEVQDLIKNRKVLVEVEKKHVEKDLLERGLLTDEIAAKLQTLKDVELVQVEQTMQLYRTNLPLILPVFIGREIYDAASGRVSINMCKNIPNKHVDLPLADRPGYAARYEWLSAVTLEQPKTTESTKVINPNSGHYTAYTRYDYKGKDVYAKYDNGLSRLHTSTAPQEADSIAQNSRLYFYEFRGIAKI